MGALSVAHHIHDGSVQKSGERLPITSQLFDAVEGRYLWLDTFDRETGAFIEIQDEIALAILVRACRDTDGVGEFIAEAEAPKPGIAISDVCPVDLAYGNPAIPERRYAAMRELGLPD